MAFSSTNRQIKTPLIALLLAIPAFGLSQLPAEKYLSQNKYTISPGDSLKNIAFLDSVLHRYSFFMTGETHGVASNTVLKMMWLKHLYHNANVRNYVIEYPYSKAYLYNIYLRTGNDSLLIEGEQEEKVFWRSLYEFNRSLPDTGKIHVIGSDFEVDWGRLVFFRKALAHMLLGKKIPEPITTYVNLLLSMNKKTTEGQARRYIRYCRQDMEENELFYREFLGKEYDSFRFMIGASLRFRPKRDRFVYSHFLKVKEKARTGNFFGQFGNSHILKGEKHSLAFLLNNSDTSPFRNKVFSVGTDYKDCYSSYGKTSRVSNTSYISTYEGKKEMQAFLSSCSSDITLFNLTAKDNPFSKLSRHYDCILLIRNQPSQKALN